MLEILPWMILVGFTVAILCSSDSHNTCNDCKDNYANNALQRLITKFRSVTQTTLHLGGDVLEHRLHAGCRLADPTGRQEMHSIQSNFELARNSRGYTQAWQEGIPMKVLALKVL